MHVILICNIDLDKKKKIVKRMDNFSMLQN